MLFPLRAACVIGAVAWFSPMHEQPPGERLATLRTLPADMTSAVVRQVPVEQVLGSEQGRALALHAVTAAVTAKDKR